MRGYLFCLLQKYEKSLKKIRSIVCQTLKEAENPNNWGENDFMKSEIQELLLSCQWYYIYDLIEVFAQSIALAKNDFEQEINEFFNAKGIGWKLHKGILEARFGDSIEEQIMMTEQVLKDPGFNTSQNEIKEAIHDLSLRPAPDITGSIQHSVAALECVCRKITNNSATLGKIINDHPDIVPKPLNVVVDKIFGFASEKGRHLREGVNPDFEEAELIVHLCASLCTYLAKKNFDSNATPWE